MPYADPNITAVSDLFSYANLITGSAAMIITLMGIWAISFLGLMVVWGEKKAFTASSFLTAVLGIILLVMDLLSKDLAYLFIILVVVGVGAIMSDRR